MIGESKAQEWILTAQRYTALEAFQQGALTKATKSEELLDSCLEFALSILKNGPIAIEHAKFAVRNGLNVDLHTGLEIESKAYGLTIPTLDRVEALKAFNEKRQPQFKGK